MHIILTANYSPWSPYCGGGQHSAHNLACCLANRGREVDVIYTQPLTEDNLPACNLPYSPHWALLPSVQSKRKSWLRNFTVYSVRNKVKSLLQDRTIIHSNGEEGALIGDLRKHHDISCVITPRYPCIPDKIQNPSLSVFTSFLDVKNTKYHLLGKALKHSDVCSPTSKFSLNMLEQHYNFDQARKSVIPNGVDNYFLKISNKNNFSGPLIFFGRLAQSKGVDTLIQAFSYIKKPDLKLLIIGRGEEKQNLINFAKKLGVYNRIIFKSWMCRNDLRSALEEASLAVLPSREESFGNTMAEAMATGTPVISTTAGSIPEVVIDGQTGILVQPNDAEALSESIKKLLSNKVIAREFAKEAKERVKRNFTWDAVAKAHEKEYQLLSL